MELVSIAKMSVHQTEKLPQFLCDQVFLEQNWDLVKNIKVES
jgi:hypothetical protein